MAVKHTPGPWVVDEPDKHGQAIVSSEHTEIATCWHHCVGAIEKEMHANARLIAAAPDLLEALRIAAGHLVWCSNAKPGIETDEGRKLTMEFADRAFAAIAKAEGRT